MNRTGLTDTGGSRSLQMLYFKGVYPQVRVAVIRGEEPGQAQLLPTGLYLRCVLSVTLFTDEAFWMRGETFDNFNY